MLSPCTISQEEEDGEQRGVDVVVVTTSNSKDNNNMGRLSVRTTTTNSTRKKGGGGQGSASSSPLSMNSLSSLPSSTRTSPLNPCFLVFLLMVVLAMNLHSTIHLDSPLGVQQKQQQQSLRKTAVVSNENRAPILAVSSTPIIHEKQQKSSEPFNHYTIIPPRAQGVVQDLVKPGDYIYYKPSPPAMPDWDSAPIVMSSHKLVFFTIPKVGCTVWKQLFRRMLGHADWKSQENGLPHDPNTNGLRYLSNYSLTEASEIMTSPEWTRAIMVRDPKTRFLSAFLDKAVSNNHQHIRSKCCGDNDVCVEQAQTIPGFLNLVKVCNDGHWKRQHERVDTKYWPYIDHVLHVENAAADARALLQRIGAWDEYGASGWAEGGENGKSLAIFESKGSQGAGEHATWSQWKHWQWYTPESEKDVEAYYRADYENPLFHFKHDCLTCVVGNETNTQQQEK